MPQEAIRIGVIATSRPPTSQWGTRTLQATAVLDVLPPLVPGTRMVGDGAVWTEYLGDFGLALHSGDTAHYIDNLRAAVPSVWVVMDRGEVRLVTVDPYEGEALAGDPERMVEAVPMPAGLAARIEAFVAAHHIPETFEKRKRKPATHSDDPRATRVLKDDEKWVQTRGRSGQRRGGEGGTG